ncbi:hypothetical protein [Brevundimonas sp. UBA7664]|uniref:hypothetical protein n=1 Tax=Brevundimonas sp. UBA7664 TaxID=1946141 RepID=UPI0025C53752|nr:hypothetical protein [Brevundimonas sp. UBA7664]
MSVTYPADPTKPYGDRVEMPRVDPHAALANDEPFVPVYARRGKARGGQGKIKTWMILTPVAVLALGGIGAMMLMQGPEEASAPLAEPALTAPVLSASPTEAALAPLTTASTPEPVIAAPAAPVAEDAAPLRRAAPAPARREAVRPAAPAPTASPRAVTPAPAVTTGPQAYTPAPVAPSTSTLNTAPSTAAPATPAPAPTPPVIIVEPVG